MNASIVCVFYITYESSLDGFTRVILMMVTCGKW